MNYMYKRYSSKRGKRPGGNLITLYFVLIALFVVVMLSLKTSNIEHSGDIQTTDNIQTTESQTSVATEEIKDPTDELIVRYIDVGQGDCALVSYGEHHMLIDGGPSGASSKVYSILKKLNITYLDYIVATHPDADHIGGLSAALNFADCGVCYCSTDKSDTKTFENLKKYLDKKNISLQVPIVDMSLEFGDADITFIGPRKYFSDDNNSSLVLKINFMDTSFLFMGDAEVDSENSILSDGVDIHADVIKIGHHGSSYSTTEHFILKVKPDFAVISVGDNKYGHPSQSVIDILNKNNCKLIRTDTDGSVIFKSNGKKLEYIITKEDIEY